MDMHPNSLQVTKEPPDRRCVVRSTRCSLGHWMVVIQGWRLQAPQMESLALSLLGRSLMSLQTPVWPAWTHSLGLDCQSMMIVRNITRS